jgi:hypothetical protein
MAFDPIRPGELAVSRSVQQILDAWQGVSGKAQPLSLTALNSSSWSLSVRNLQGNHARFLSSAGAELFTITDAGINLSEVSLSGPLGFDPGTLAAPGLYVTGDTNTGLYAPVPGQLAIVTDGVARIVASSAGTIAMTGDVSITGGLTFSGSLAPTGEIILPQILTPSAPASGTAIYSKSGGGIYVRAAAGSEIQLADLSSAQTFTNKTLTSPIITGLEVRNLIVENAAGSATVANFRDEIVYFGQPIRLGNNVGVDDVVTADPIHAMYLHYNLTGAYSSATDIVDTFIVEISSATDDDADLGAILGVARAQDAVGVSSMRALAGQLFVYDGAQKADREAVELGVHNALAITSKADNRTVFDEVFGTTGILITAFNGAIETGGTGVDANTAIVVASIDDSVSASAGFKQFEVFWDKEGVKAWQVSGQGNVVAGGGGNNDDLPCYGFLDTNGDVDTGTGMFWGGNDVIGFATNQVEVGRFGADGLFTANLGIKNSGKNVLGGAITDTIAADQNNYAPTGIASAAFVQVTATGAQRTITGFAVSGAVEGQTFIFVNTGGQNIVLAHNSGSSSAGNLINTHTSLDFTLAPGEGVLLFRTAAAVWRTLGFNAS